MNLLKNILTRRLASDLLAAKIAQLVCYAVAIGVFVLATIKLARLPTSEVELFFGILLILAVFCLMICGGTLVRIDAELRKRNETDAG